jgi:hypothetical protein
LSAIALVMVAGTGITGLGWFSLQLIVNPQSLTWVNRFVPDWIPNRTLEPAPQTLHQIRTALRQAGHTVGEPIVLGKNISVVDGKSAATDLLLPVLQPQANGMDGISELRVYQTESEINPTTKDATYRLVHTLEIKGLEESFVIAPLVDAHSESQGSSRFLPLTELKPFEGKAPHPGLWFNLSGKRLWGNDTIAYGQVLYYSPDLQHLGIKLQWTSPVGEPPVWKQVTGDDLPELIVNQTQGLEPLFEIYQVKPLNFVPSPWQLEPISLTEAELDDSVYRQALLLGRSGLWSTSLQWFQGLQQRIPRKQWSVTVQAQMDLIRWHTRLTQTQAEASWASPSQQVLANLIDGRWERALTVFESSVEASQETVNLLRGDGGRLEKRIKAAIATAPTKPASKAWGTLFMAVRQNPAMAIAWLKKQPKTSPNDIIRIVALTKRLDPNFTEANSLSSSMSRIVGTVSAISTITSSDWLYPKAHAPLQPDENQAWYQVQVTGFHDGNRWRFSQSGLDLPTSSTAADLWKLLNLETASTLQLLLWQADGQQQTLWANIKAARIQGDRLELLVSADPSVKLVSSHETPPPLALSESALQWLTPETLSLSEWLQQHPIREKSGMATLIQELKPSRNLPTNQQSIHRELERLGADNWIVQTAHLTNRQHPDLILTIPSDSLMALGYTATKQPHTVIISATGKLVYSELSLDAKQTYLAIADLGDNQPTLVVHKANHYRLLRWSSAKQQFE